MEVLSDVLRSLRASGSVFFCDRMEAPWSAQFSEVGQASFHVVRRGACWLSSDGVITERLDTGDLVFAGPARTHTLSSAHPTDGRVADDETVLLCGYCRFDVSFAHPLISAIPSLVIVRAEQLEREPWLVSTLDRLSTEYLAKGPGSDVVVDRLTEILLVELIRMDFGRGSDTSFIRALSDEPVHRALALLHKSPETAWTLEKLAARIGLSRAALAKRFKQCVGRTMFAYLTLLRMQKAATLLSTSDAKLIDIAESVGYESEVAFMKTFKRTVGMTPTQYRKRDPRTVTTV
jgi:AraC-like DNA-binding protein